MPEFLSKEEVKQWRSSLEKITLEEYAARLGKSIESDKQTNDLIDIVLKGQPIMSRVDDLTQTRGEKLSSIAQRAFEREKEISNKPFKAPAINESNKQKEKKPIVKAEKAEKPALPNKEISLKDEVRLVLSKSLTDREQVIFDCFLKNKNQIVYAKDLAKLLDLPRDYVYKYIKNLRTKIEGDKLQNADNGGYVLSV